MYNNRRRIDLLKTYDPRTKLHISLMFLISVLVSWKLIPVLISTLFAFFLILLSRVRLSSIASSAIGLILLEVVLGIVLVIILPFQIGLYILLKLVSLTWVYLAVRSTMKQGEGLDAMAVGFGMRAATTRKIYLFLDFPEKVIREKRRARAAQRARGVDPGGNVFSRFHKELLLAIPNISSAVIRTKWQSEAMDKMGYQSTKRRRPFQTMQINAVDKVASIFFMILMLACIITMLFI